MKLLFVEIQKRLKHLSFNKTLMCCESIKNNDLVNKKDSQTLKKTKDDKG